MISDIIAFLAYWITAVPVFVGLLKFKRLDFRYRIIFFYVLLSFCTELTCFIIRPWRINNLIIGNIYTIMEFLLITEFIRNSYLNDHKKVIRIIQVVFAFISLCYFTYQESFMKHNELIRGLASLIIVILCIERLYQQLNGERRPKQEATFVYTIITFFIYFSLSVMIFINAKTFASIDIAIENIAWNIHSILAIFLYTLLTVVLWMHKPN